MRPLRLALIGTSFMGRAHSNAWSQVRRFCDPALTPVLQVACGRDHARTAAFAARWGWEAVETEWRRAVTRDDVDAVDISVPTHLHAEIAIAAARAGKHVFCEKPMATSLAEARAMHAAASQAGVVHYLNHNYRRTPAVQLAKRLIDEGRLGRIFHWRGAYQQDWIVDPDFPLTWHLRQDQAGAGPHADLHSHSVDLAHFLVGPIASVACLTTTFIPERPLPGAGAATFQAGARAGGMGRVTVEDASLMQVSFAQGALGSFEATRFATGRKNHQTFEIYGSQGSLSFDLERLNELGFYDATEPEDRRGFRTILATEACHPYVRHWWPPGHVLGYEHTFVHAALDFCAAVAGQQAVRPDFADGCATTAVLEAALTAAATGQRVAVATAGPALTAQGAR